MTDDPDQPTERPDDEVSTDNLEPIPIDPAVLGLLLIATTPGVAIGSEFHRVVLELWAQLTRAQPVIARGSLAVCTEQGMSPEKVAEVSATISIAGSC